MAIDTLYQVNTPEGINLRLSPAGPLVRMFAWSIDILIRSAAYIVMYVPLAFMGNTGIGIFLILLFILEWFYPVYFELFKNGQTPGKKMFNLYVTMENASPINTGASVTRNLLRFADFLPLFYGFGLISMMLNKRFQRLGDLVASTVVLHKALDYPAIEQDETQAVTPPVALQLNEQQALIQFQQRIPYISTDRAEELARLTLPLVEKDQQATPQLLGFANWIMGTANK